MPAGGDLNLQTSAVYLDEAFCNTVPDLDPGPFIKLRITDSGVGMDEMTIKHIYEPFFTSKALGKGSGLGLAMVYGLIKQHNGYIECHSELNVGTTFDIYLPFASKGGENPDKRS